MGSRWSTALGLQDTLSEHLRNEYTEGCFILCRVSENFLPEVPRTVPCHFSVSCSDFLCRGPSVRPCSNVTTFLHWRSYDSLARGLCLSCHGVGCSAMCRFVACSICFFRCRSVRPSVWTRTLSTHTPHLWMALGTHTLCSLGPCGLRCLADTMEKSGWF